MALPPSGVAWKDHSSPFWSVSLPGLRAELKVSAGTSERRTSPSPCRGRNRRLGGGGVQVLLELGEPLPRKAVCGLAWGSFISQPP